MSKIIFELNGTIYLLKVFKQKCERKSDRHGNQQENTLKMFKQSIGHSHEDN